MARVCGFSAQDFIESRNIVYGFLDNLLVGGFNHVIVHP